jgi:uncharacterized membrane protein YciS (DUF1049 family)
MSTGRWIVVVLVVLTVLAGVAFSVQNSARTTQLSFDVGVAAWELEQPLSIPLLIGVCFGSGLALGVATMGVRAARLAMRVRQLEQQVALQGFSSAAPSHEDAKRW